MISFSPMALNAVFMFMILKLIFLTPSTPTSSRLTCQRDRALWIFHNIRSSDGPQGKPLDFYPLLKKLLLSLTFSTLLNATVIHPGASTKKQKSQPSCHSHLVHQQVLTPKKPPTSYAAPIPNAIVQVPEVSICY